MPRRIEGDFNSFHFPSERSGLITLLRQCMTSHNFISVHGLVDIPMAGGRLHGPIPSLDPG